MNKPIANYEFDGWRFWLQWVAANTLGMAIAFFGSFLLIDVALRFIIGQSLDEVMNREGLGFLISLSVIFTVSGAGIGLMQWLALRRHIASASGIRWVLANALGFAIVVILYFVLYGRIAEVINEIVHNLLGGAALGIIQSQILKQRAPHAGWWVPVSSVGMVIAGLSSYLLGGGPINMVIGIALMAACTGIFLVWLLRLPSPEAVPVT
jgi:hypothetical protein